MPHPTLTPQQASRVIDAMRRLRSERFSGSVSNLARALGRQQPSVTQLLAGKHGPSYQTAVTVAKLLGQSVWQLFGEAGIDPCMLDIDRPNLTQALDLTTSKVSAAARERVLASARFLPDLPLSIWTSVLLETERFLPQREKKP